MNGKTFTLFFSSSDISRFDQFVTIAKRLKKHGRVQVNVSSQVDKSWFEVPAGGSPWHEYTCKHAALWKFFPHPRIEPFLPADWLRRNQAFLRAKLDVLRKHELEAFFWTSEPHYMPEPFFAAHPHLRGPRVDHPRRSKQAAFAMCVDHPEALAMIEWMAGRLKEAAPQLTGYLVNIDDAGAGLCWSNTLYSGANGPDACRGRHIGTRVRDLFEAIRRGAQGDGELLEMHLSGNIPREQQEKIRPYLPPGSYLHDGHWHDTERMMGVSRSVELHYPVLGLINPLDIFASLERLDDPQVEKVILDFRSDYDRGDESLEAIDRTIGFIEQALASPLPRGRLNRMRTVRASAVPWCGEDQADAVTEAFVAMQDAFRLCSLMSGGRRAILPLYGGVAMRFLTRPLVIKPDLLTPEEEAYFLPYVFNIHEHEARQDYIDFTGTRIPPTSYRHGPDAIVSTPLQAALADLRKAAQTFESIRNAAETEWFQRLATALKIRISILRSYHNFYCAQMIRDENAAILSGEPRVPEKAISPLGEKGNLAWKRLMRDELDNTNDLITLLEHGGLEFLDHAADAEHTDIFLLEPDLIDSLRRKVKIMLNHWLDVDRYLASPMK